MQVQRPSSQFMTSKGSSFSNCLGIASMSFNRMVIRHKPPNHTFHHFADWEREAQEAAVDGALLPGPPPQLSSPSPVCKQNIVFSRPGSGNLELG